MAHLSRLVWKDLYTIYIMELYKYIKLIDDTFSSRERLSSERERESEGEDGDESYPTLLVISRFFQVKWCGK